MNEEDKLIEEQLKTLPSELQKAISSVPWKDLVQEIGKQNNLSVEQIESLERETMFIIYGFENPNDYISNLIREAGVDETTATTIANEVGEKILKAIEEKTGSVVPVSIPATPPANLPLNLPMVEKGETVRDVPHMEQSKTEIRSEQPKVPLPDYRYEEGKDPYREPLK